MSFSIQSMANWNYGDDDWWYYGEHRLGNRYDWYGSGGGYTSSYGGAGGSSGGSSYSGSSSGYSGSSYGDSSSSNSDSSYNGYDNSIDGGVLDEVVVTATSSKSDNIDWLWTAFSRNINNPYNAINDYNAPTNGNYGSSGNGGNYGSDKDDFPVGFSPESGTGGGGGPYVRQTSELSCVPACMAIINMVMDGISLEQAYNKYNEYIEKYRELYGKNVRESGVPTNMEESFIRECGFKVNKCLTGSIETLIEHGYKVITTIDDFSVYGRHAIVITDTYRNEKGEIRYNCINPATGKKEEGHKTSYIDDYPERTYVIKQTNLQTK